MELEHIQPSDLLRNIPLMRTSSEHESTPSAMLRGSSSNCPTCGGFGLVEVPAVTAAAQRLIAIYRAGERVWTPCDCAAGVERTERHFRRAGIAAEDRSIRLDSSHLRGYPWQQPAIDACLSLLSDPRGWLTLEGPNGRGKTMLLLATLNHLRDAAIIGAYITAPQLAAQMRALARDGEALIALQDRLVELPVLAIDELCKIGPSEFVEERLFRVLDERERAWETRITLFAHNRPERVPEYLLSRMQARRFRFVRMAGEDLRPHVGSDDER